MLAQRLISFSKYFGRVYLPKNTKILIRSHTPGSPPASCEELTNIALSLRERVGLSPQQPTFSDKTCRRIEL